MPYFNVALKNNRFVIFSVVLDARSLTQNKLSEYVQNNSFEGDDRLRARALIDTGATHCSITDEIATKLNLKPVGRHKVGTAGYPLECNQYIILLGIPVKEITGTEKTHDKETNEEKVMEQGVMYYKMHMARVSSLPKQEEDRGFDVIIGMDFLGKMMFQYSGNPMTAEGGLTIGF